jgi:hypothetical protein
MAARLRWNAAAERLEGRKTVKVDRQEDLEALAFEQQDCEDAARDAARFTALLTAVDGAVVLTAACRIIGFGAEVKANFSGIHKIHVAQDQVGRQSKEVSFMEYGTRHRSAFRFVGSMESAVAIVMSQDGGVKALRQVGPRLLMWPYFRIGFAPGAVVTGQDFIPGGG